MTVPLLFDGLRERVEAGEPLPASELAALRRALRFERRVRAERAAAWAVERSALPREYDEAGFPIDAQMPSFIERVRRLLIAR
jgi:hypothetical protein